MQSVGRLPFGSRDEVFKIQKVCVLSLVKGELEYLRLDKCGQDSCTRPVILIPSPNEPMVSASFRDGDGSELGTTLTIHSLGTSTFGSAGLVAPSSGRSMQKTWNQIKLTASNVKPKVSNKLGLTSGGSSTQLNRIEEKEKIERRLIDVSFFQRKMHNFIFCLL